MFSGFFVRKQQNKIQKKKRQIRKADKPLHICKFCFFGFGEVLHMKNNTFGINLLIRYTKIAYRPAGWNSWTEERKQLYFMRFSN